MSDDSNRSNSQSSMTGPPGSDEQPPKKRKRRIKALIPPNNNLGEDELMVKTFADLAQLRVDHGDFTNHRKEVRDDLAGVRKALRQPGFYWGCAAAVTQFVFLRKAPKWYLNRSLSIKTSFLHGRNGNPHYHSSRRQKNPLFPRIRTQRDGSTTFHEGILTASVTTVLDLSLSLFGGGVVWYYMTDKKQLFHAVSSIPLKSGESVISRVLCDDFLTKDREIPKHLWTEHTDDVVQNLRRFIDNCQRRRQYEVQLREERGIPATEPVTIPLPGVPPDLPLEVEEKKEEGLFEWASEDDYWGEEDDDWEEEEEEDDFWNSGR